MIEVAVASGKGGVGKSTVSATIALAAARAGRSVVAVDADADAPNLHLIFGVREWEWERPYVESRVAEIVQSLCTGCGRCREACPYDAIYVDEEGRHEVNQVVCEGCMTCSLVCPERGAIRLLSAESGRLRRTTTGYGFPLISARLNPGRPNSGKLVTEEKSMARELASQGSLIVVDSAAGIGCQVVSSLAGANAAILVAEPTPASFAALRRILRLARHFMQPAGLVINKHDVNPEVTEDMEEFARERNVDLLGRIPYDDAIPKSMAMMRPAVEAFPDSPASRALMEVAERVMEIVDDWRSWFARFRPREPEPYRPIIIRPEGYGQ